MASYMEHINQNLCDYGRKRNCRYYSRASIIFANTLRSLSKLKKKMSEYLKCQHNKYRNLQQQLNPAVQELHQMV